ncbi:MAG: hypothetical protein U1C51_01070, partial [Candidatus Izemoplasmatales bacterium]|nr:hypothetical protein [Candidatus Izemoplasmatales bacterium]
VASGSFEIHSAIFSTSAPATVVLENSFDGKGNGVNTNMYWDKSGPADPFVVSYVESVATIVATKSAGQQWTTIRTPLNGDFRVFGTIEIMVKGPADTQIMFKINPSFEKWVTLTGEVQTIMWDISGVTPAVLENIEYLYAFPGAHTDAEFAGTFEIHSVKWYRPVNEYVAADPIVDFDVNMNWQDEYLEGFTIIPGAQSVVVDYSRTAGGWALIRSYVRGSLSNFDYVVLEITGTAGKQIILKVEGPGVGKDIWFTLTGDKDVVVLDISTLSVVQRDAIKMVLVFAEPGVDVASGSFEIHEAYFTQVNPVQPL